MSYLQPTKTTADNGAVVWQKVLEVSQGGYSLDATGLTAGATLAAGTALICNDATRTATVVDADADTPTGCLYEDVVIAEGAPLVQVLRGTMYSRRLSHAASKTAAIKAKLPHIIYSESF